MPRQIGLGESSGFDAFHMLVTTQADVDDA